MWTPSRSLLTYSGRVALAATLGLIVSILIGLHEPHWAAWTVVSVGNAVRGDGLLKSLYRAIGTAVGAPVGVLLIFVAHGNEPLLVGLLAVWLAVCVYVGISMRNYRAYAAVLAGYSAAIIAMSLIGESGKLLEIGADRCIGIFIGIACALLVLLLSRDAQSGRANRRIRHAIATACAWCADRLAGLPRARAADGVSPQRLRGQLIDILGLDGAVHSAAAESPALWRRTSRLHGVVSALVDLLVVSRGVERNIEQGARTHNEISGEIDDAVAEAAKLLASVSGALRSDEPDDIEKLERLRGETQVLRARLASVRAGNVRERRRLDLLTALLGAAEATMRTYAALTGAQDDNDTTSYPAPVYAVNRSYALAAALRAGCTLLLAGAIWVATGWHSGPLLVAFTAVAISLFAIRPNPLDTAFDFVASGSVGAGIAVLFYATVTPHISHAIGVALAEGAMVFVAVALASMLSNAFWASGFCMLFLAITDPTALAGTTASAVSTHALGAVAGGVLAALAYRVVPSRPVENRWRKQHLEQTVHAITGLIALPFEPRIASTHHAWQTHSLDTLMRLALPAASETDIDECVTWIEIGVELIKLQDELRADAALLPPGVRKTIDSLFEELRNGKPRTWHSTVASADAELNEVQAVQNDPLPADQTVLSIRMRVAELTALLRRVDANTATTEMQTVS
ncbi:FUSC family protein [Paraburkholderia edwinii]|uniref:FUSC family protein n=1 Tax=Paraburkholderia edwinii TaxID=2861782 RepID=A0ABX8UUD5_9BURK|nr:FUSC family protein [Paraburkholderia edwinii]QYD72621.1 FUSC family protein [Paraburkholderia edwinii]